MKAEEDQIRSTSASPEQAPNPGFTGTISLQLPDLIQMVCLCRANLSIYVKSSSGSGSIHIRNGHISHARTEDLVGDAAFFEILRWEDGRFETSSSTDAKEETVTKPWEHLLFEVARRRDEGGSESDPMRPELDLDLDLDRELDAGLAFESENPISGIATVSAPPSPALTAEASIVKVLVVDDSSFFARRLREMLESDSRIEVVGMAGNGEEALRFLEQRPEVDVITLDVQMPGMRGDTALKHIMVRYPIPVLMISSFDPNSLARIYEFMRLGAVDFISKPNGRESAEEYGRRLCDLVRRASKANPKRFRRVRKPKIAPKSSTNSSAETIEEGRDAPPRSPGHLDRSSEKPASPGEILVILGAEGAHMEWFRLPLATLCRKGLIIGLQKLEDQFLPVFCRLLQEEASVNADPVPDDGECITPGKVFMSNANRIVRITTSLESMQFKVERQASPPTEWSQGAASWLRALAAQVGSRLNVYLLSAAHSLESDLIEELMESGAKLIISPTDSLLCQELVESAAEYAYLYPEKIFTARSEELSKILGWEEVA